MARMVAIGPERFTLAFGALGFEVIDADRSSFAEVFEQLAKDRSVGLIACGESLVGPKPDEDFRELCLTSHAAILIAPDGPEARGTGMELARVAVDQAAGVDLLSATEVESEHNA